MTKKEKTRTVILKDADDGSGDAILIFPEGLTDEMGWAVGDKIDVQPTSDKDGRQGLVMKKLADATPDSL
jgi:hypothetical protein